MNFYVDFEALQFSGRIISIGCVNDNGDKFYTLLKPAKRKEKVNSFITKLTGITNEMLSMAPTADEAFSNFYDYIISNSNGENSNFYCYGDADKEFLKATYHYLNSWKAREGCDYVCNNLVDYSINVQRFFSVKDGIALKKVYNLIKENTDPQRHNALEDAEMLVTVVKNLYDCCSPSDISKIRAMPSTRIPRDSAHSHSSKRAPQKFLEWPPNKLDADTGANEENWEYKWSRKNQVKYFDSFDTMVMWAMKYICEGRSIKKQSDINAVSKRIRKGIENNTLAYNGKWERRKPE